MLNPMEFFVRVGILLSLVSSVTGQGTAVFSFTASDSSLLGTNVSFRCQYTYVDQESANNVKFQRKSNTDADFVSIVEHGFNGDVPIWTNPDLESRSEISLRVFPLPPYGILKVRNLRCTDEVEYRCIFTVQSQRGFNQTYSSLTDFKVNGKAQKPVLTYGPSTIVENQRVTFTCTGNVGRPAGSLTMFPYNTIDGRQEQQLQARQTTSLIEALNSCTYERTIEATYNFTANQKTMVVICEVDQAYVDVENKQAMTGQLDIKYFPRSTQIEAVADGRTVPSQDEVTVTEESNVQLKCTTDSNPEARYQWSYRLDNINETIYRAPDSTGILLLNRTTMDQTGKYLCNATNVVIDFIYFDQQSIRLIVTGMPPISDVPSTLIQSTTSGIADEMTNSTAVDPGSGSVTGAVVGAIFGILLALGLLTFGIIWYRRHKTTDKTCSESYRPALGSSMASSDAVSSPVTNDTQETNLDHPYRRTDYENVPDMAPSEQNSNFDQQYERLQLQLNGAVYENTTEEHTYEGHLSSLPVNPASMDPGTYEQLQTQNGGGDYENNPEEHVYE